MDILIDVILRAGRSAVELSLFVLLPKWLGFYGIYLVGPCADLPFAIVAAALMVRELAKLRGAPGVAKQPALTSATG